jgi:hypothetical protein
MYLYCTLTLDNAQEWFVAAYGRLESNNLVPAYLLEMHLVLIETNDLNSLTWHFSPFSICGFSYWGIMNFGKPNCLPFSYYLHFYTMIFDLLGWISFSAFRGEKAVSNNEITNSKPNQVFKCSKKNWKHYIQTSHGL